MAEFDLDKMADRVAEKALDEFTYKDKTLREWVEIIVAQDLLAITELEKIKEKVKQRKILPKTSARSDYEMGLIDGRSTEKVAIMGIIGKEIAELKGGQKW